MYLLFWGIELRGHFSTQGWTIARPQSFVLLKRWIEGLEWSYKGQALVMQATVPWLMYGILYSPPSTTRRELWAEIVVSPENCQMWLPNKIKLGIERSAGWQGRAPSQAQSWKQSLSTTRVATSKQPPNRGLLLIYLLFKTTRFLRSFSKIISPIDHTSRVQI